MTNVQKNSGERLVALDALRGLAVAGMILVTSPGSWADAHPQLQHAAWHGWTLGDMVFPTFLFAVGCALGLSFPRRDDRREVGTWAKILRRSLLLIGLGLALNALPHFDLATLRLPGILQRIGLCYAVAAALCLLTARSSGEGRLALNFPALWVAVLALLVGYWALLTFAPTPGFGVGRLDSYGSLPAYVDRLVFTVPHLWRWGVTDGVGVTYDPEGLVSTLGALVNTLAGVLAAALLKRGDRRRLSILLVGAGLALMLAAELIAPSHPINKRIWTSTFAILSTGFSLAIFGALALALTFGGAEKLAWPLRVLGGNAIVAFVLSQLLGVFSTLAVIPGPGGAVTPQTWGFRLAQVFIPNATLASFACAVAILLLITAVLVPLHRRGLHLRL